MNQSKRERIHTIVYIGIEPIKLAVEKLSLKYKDGTTEHEQICFKLLTTLISAFHLELPIESESNIPSEVYLKINSAFQEIGNILDSGEEYQTVIVYR